ncbi:MAG: hypothetical protein K8L99_11730 [Anaerolineae bacterium]|nr:hypothetical protein [Anaerolineae bacterium]
MAQQKAPTPHIEPQAVPPDHFGVMIAAVLMALGGWGGLYVLVTTTLPRVGQRWLFFMLLQIAVVGTVLPFVRYLNLRFTPLYYEIPPGGVLVRQSVWIGLFIVTCAWLQIPRVLTPAIAFLLILVFLVIEVFLRSREMANERYDN